MARIFGPRFGRELEVDPVPFGSTSLKGQFKITSKSEKKQAKREAKKARKQAKREAKLERKSAKREAKGEHKKAKLERKKEKKEQKFAKKIQKLKEKEQRKPQKADKIERKIDKLEAKLEKKQKKIDRKIDKVEQKFDLVDHVQFQPISVPPPKIPEGLVILADGSNWEPIPGRGGGLFVYDQGAWNKLGTGLIGDKDSVDFKNDVTGPEKPENNADVTRWRMGDDVVLNGSFETGTFEGWDETTNAALVNDPSLAPVGSWLARITPGDVGLRSQPYTVTPGDRYILKCVALRDENSLPDQGLRLSLEFEDSNGAHVQFSNEAVAQTNISGAQSLEVLIDVPNNSSIARARIAVRDNTGTTGAWYVDAFRLVPMIRESQIDVLLTQNAPAEAGAEQTTGKSISVLTDRTADQIAETVDKKWAAESGATVGGTVDDGSGVGNVKLPDGTKVRNNMLLLKDITVTSLPSAGTHDGQLVLLDGNPPIWYQWDATAGTWLKRGPSVIGDLPDDIVYGKVKLTALTGNEIDLTKSGVLNKTADQIAETLNRKWAAESGATVGGTVDDGSGVGNVKLPDGTKVRNNMLLLKDITVTSLPSSGTHDGQLILLDGTPPTWYQWDSSSSSWVKRGPSVIGELPDDTVYGKVKLSALTGNEVDFSKSGVLNKLLDNIADTTNFAKVSASDLTNNRLDFSKGWLNKTIDYLGDGSTYGRAKLTALTGGEVDLAKSGVLNRTLDNIADTTNFAKVSTSDLTNNRLDFSKSWLNKTIDYLNDGSTYGRVKNTALTLGEVDISLDGVINKTADQIAESATRKWAGQSGADVTVDSGFVTLANPNFARGLTGWTVIGGTVTADPTGGPNGGPAVKLTLPANTGPSGFASVQNDVRIPVQEGDRLQVLVSVKGPAGAQSGGRWQLKWFDIDGNQLSGTEFGYATADGSFHSVRRVTNPAPTGAVEAALGLVAQNGSSTLTTQEDWWMTGCAVVYMPRHTDIDALQTANAPAEAGAEKTTGKSLTILTDLNVDYLSESSTRFFAAEPNADKTSSRIGGGLLVNGGFETGSTANWGAALSAQLSIVAGIHNGSSYACKYSVNGSGPGWRLYQWIPVIGGERYLLTAFVQRDEGDLPNDNLAFGASFYDASSSSLGGVDSNVSQSSSGLQVVRVVADVPTGATRAAIRFRAPTRSTDGSGYWIVDTVSVYQIPRDANDVPYADGTAIETLKPAEAGAEKTTGKSIDILVDGSTYGRVKLAALTSGNVDVSKSGVTNKSLDYFSDSATRKAVSEVDANGRAIIDFTQSGHVGKGALATKDTVDDPSLLGPALVRTAEDSTYLGLGNSAGTWYTVASVTMDVGPDGTVTVSFLVSFNADSNPGVEISDFKWKVRARQSPSGSWSDVVQERIIPNVSIWDNMLSAALPAVIGGDGLWTAPPSSQTTYDLELQVAHTAGSSGFSASTGNPFRVKWTAL